MAKTRKRRAVESQPWPAFEGKLAETLGALEEDQFLVVSAKRGWAFVQFAAQGSYGLRAESISNNYLPSSRALNDVQLTRLREIGWMPPTGTAEQATPELQPNGSPNFFCEFPKPVSFIAVARMAVRTLTEVFKIPHPGFLDYQAFDTSDRAILLPTLGLMRRAPLPSPAKPQTDTVESVRQLTLDAIRKAAEDPTIAFQDDDSLPLRVGSALVIVRVHEEPFCVSIVSPILVKVDTDDLLVNRLNELNAKVRFARFFVEEGTVYAATEVFASPLVAEHVVQAFGLLGSLADDVDEMLHAQFGGRTAFGEFRSTARVH